MKPFALFFILFWITIIIFPKFLAYLIGGFFVFVWVSMLSVGSIFNFGKKSKEDNYIKFGKYKIFR